MTPEKRVGALWIEAMFAAIPVMMTWQRRSKSVEHISEVSQRGFLPPEKKNYSKMVFKPGVDYVEMFLR